MNERTPELEVGCFKDEMNCIISCRARRLPGTLYRRSKNTGDTPNIKSLKHAPCSGSDGTPPSLHYNVKNKPLYYINVHSIASHHALYSYYTDIHKLWRYSSIDVGILVFVCCRTWHGLIWVCTMFGKEVYTSALKGLINSPLKGTTIGLLLTSVW